MIDADGVLILISDHGIRNTLEHDPNCVFKASAPGLVVDRLEDRPEIGGTGRMIAELLSVETDWPATGMESWVAEIPAP